VVRRGTAARAGQLLKRLDLAGKTGTTNDYVDAWFCGYQPTLVAIAWIGFDQPKRLGSGETGASAALPMWISYMEKMLKGVPESYMEKPAGLVAVSTEDPGGKSAAKELIYKESMPEPLPEEAPATGGNPAAPGIPVVAPAPDAKPKAADKADKKEAAPVQEAKPKAVDKKDAEPHAPTAPALPKSGGV